MRDGSPFGPNPFFFLLFGGQSFRHVEQRSGSAHIGTGRAHNTHTHTLWNAEGLGINSSSIAHAGGARLLFADADVVSRAWCCGGGGGARIVDEKTEFFQQDKDDDRIRS